LTLASTSVFASDDPLFQRMAGHWTGEGDRVYPLANRRGQVQIEVTSVEKDGKLISTNRITELLVGEKKPRVTVRTYWIRAKDGAPGQYELGYQQSDQVAATGTLNGEIFDVDQKMGSNLSVHSTTEFNGDHCVYNEDWRQGETQVTETVIKYSRN
ncbi:MAG: hypothetical protein ACXWP5_10955, partial [Bdellovibrionota bacterium]